MDEKPKKIITDTEKITDIIGWLNLADDDYLSARVLINNGLLVQGAILSSTAIEKYLKMIHQVKELKFQNRGNPHDVLDLYNNLKKNTTDINVNEDYLKLLVKIYKFRYPDKIESNYSFGLNQSKLMFALDESVHNLRKGIKIVNNKGEELTNSKLHALLKENDPRISIMNHAFGKVKREDVFSKPSTWHEMRFVNGKVWLEMHYTANVKDDNIYNLEGMKQGKNDREFNLNAEPIDSNLNLSQK